MNKIEMQMKLEKQWDWFHENNIKRIWKLAHAELKIKNKDMPWYKKLLYNNDNYQWIEDRADELLKLEFNDALEVANE